MKNNPATVQAEILSDQSVAYNVVQNGEAIMHPATEAEAIAICQHINSELKHTPGPWKSAGESIINEADTCCIAAIESDGGYEAPQEQREANARLIAAAPDLLQAPIFTNCDSDNEGCFCNCPLADGTRPDKDHATSCVVARHAIAQAKGEK